MINIPNCSEFGWDVHGNIEWIKDPYPEEIENIPYEEERAYDEETESDSDEEDEI